MLRPSNINYVDVSRVFRKILIQKKSDPIEKIRAIEGLLRLAQSWVGTENHYHVSLWSAKNKVEYKCYRFTYRIQLRLKIFYYHYQIHRIEKSKRKNAEVLIKFYNSIPINSNYYNTLLIFTNTYGSSGIRDTEDNRNFSVIRALFHQIILKNYDKLEGFEKLTVVKKLVADAKKNNNY